MPNELPPAEAAPGAYPDTASYAARLRAALGLPAAGQVLLSSGAEGAIKAATSAIGGAQLVLEPGFGAAREVLADRAVVVRLPEVDAPYPADEILRARADHAVTAVHLPAVMNPTAQPLPHTLVEALLDAREAPLVIVDDVYGRLDDGSWTGRAARTDGLLAIGSVSKVGGAGLRVGFAVGTRSTIARVRRCFPTHPVPAYALEAAVALIADRDALRDRLAERERLTAQLADHLVGRGCDARLGCGWVLARLGWRAPAIAEALRSRGHAVESYPRASSILYEYLKLSASGPDRVLTLVRAIDHHLEEFIHD